MLEKYLQEIIPENISIFPKINKTGDPYYFKSWDTDEKNKETILRYWFWNKQKIKKNKKRLFINEFELLIKYSLKSGFITRKDYACVCKRSNKDGTCGFAVVIAILEYLDLIFRVDRGKYKVFDERKTKELLYKHKDDVPV